VEERNSCCHPCQIIGLCYLERDCKIKMNAPMDLQERERVGETREKINHFVPFISYSTVPLEIIGLVIPRGKKICILLFSRVLHRTHVTCVVVHMRFDHSFRITDNIITMALINET
jgi:hypothetical protein